MKKCWLIIFMICVKTSFSQQVYEEELEEQIESLAEHEAEEIDDDTWIQQLQHYRKHPINLNTANEEVLTELQILSPVQIQQLLRYRTLLGSLIHVNELQAVPGWNVSLIKKIIPYVTVGNEFVADQNIASRFKRGNYTLLFRASQQLENSGDGLNNASFAGSPQYLQFRFKYRYANLLQYGFIAEKDAGEKLFSRTGFDFYSLHLYLREFRFVKRLVLGDFTIKMGQGLVQWQGMVNKKSSNVLSIKQQQEIVNPYSSAGETYFYRGLALTAGVARWQFTSFFSTRKISAHVERDSMGYAYVSSISTSGYHRTASERAQKNAMKQLVAGCNVTFQSPSIHLGLNLLHQKFALPINKGNEPYQRFSIHGKAISNGSIDYSFTHQNFHVFGEISIDQQFNKALLNGLILSVDKKLDISLLYRNISPAYQSMNANAFVENSTLSNETGLYCGMRLVLFLNCDVQGYVDVFAFPWLKYNVDAPSMGRDFFVQLNYQPSKKILLSARYKRETKEGNGDSPFMLANLMDKNKYSWRYQLKWEFSKELILAYRVELSRYDAIQKEHGALCYIDVSFKPLRKPFKLSGRLQTFTTDGYDSRIYSFEKGVLFDFGIPAYFGKGWNYFINLNHEFRRRNKGPHQLLPTECWMSWSQVFSQETGLAFNLVNHSPQKTKSSLTIQAVYLF